MGTLIAGMLDGLGIPSGLAGDTTPYVPSAPVQIGTSGARHGVSETGSWQVLLVMFGLVLCLGAAVLLYAVRQRTRVLARRRVRRMGQAAALVAERAEMAEMPETNEMREMNEMVELEPVAGTQGTTAPPRGTPAAPGRPAPNA